MAISKVNRVLIISGILLIYVVICTCFLLNHYEDVSGSCVCILYYHPLSISDRLLLLLYVGITGVVIWYFGRYKLALSNWITLLLIALCIFTATILGLYGNDILGSRTEHWPHKYHPVPFNSHNAPKHYEDLLYGTWIFVT